MSAAGVPGQSWLATVWPMTAQRVPRSISRSTSQRPAASPCMPITKWSGRMPLVLRRSEFPASPQATETVCVISGEMWETSVAEFRSERASRKVSPGERLANSSMRLEGSLGTTLTSSSPPSCCMNTRIPSSMPRVSDIVAMRLLTPSTTPSIDKKLRNLCEKISRNPMATAARKLMPAPP